MPSRRPDRSAHDWLAMSAQPRTGRNHEDATDLSERQARAIPALMSNPTLAKAARAAGVGERTLRRWLGEDEGFKVTYREARSEAMRQATARLQAAAGEAVDTLRELMGLRDRPDIRARAALGILTTSLKAEELENLAARIEALERPPGNPGRQWPTMAG